MLKCKESIFTPNHTFLLSITDVCSFFYAPFVVMLEDLTSITEVVLLKLNYLFSFYPVFNEIEESLAGYKKFCLNHNDEF